jgi:hypothetical protein
MKEVQFFPTSLWPRTSPHSSCWDPSICIRIITFVLTVRDNEGSAVTLSGL